jgi:hypothetical protein
MIDQNRVFLSRYPRLSPLPFDLSTESLWPKFLTTSIQNANLARAEARAASRIVDRILLIQEHRLDTGASKTFQPQAWGLTSITAIARDSLQFEKRSQLFIRRTTKRFPSSRCASAIQIVRPTQK